MKYGNLISRQEAIDAVKKNTFRLTFAEEQNCEGHVAWSAEAVYSDVIEGALLELPSAQPDLDSAYTEGYTQAEAKYRKMWDEMPKIIRCKDCKHYNAGFECLIEGYGIERNKDWFCADAERREKDEE